jgi:hypothetical protein
MKTGFNKIWIVLVLALMIMSCDEINPLSVYPDYPRKEVCRYSPININMTSLAEAVSFPNNRYELIDCVTGEVVLSLPVTQEALYKKYWICSTGKVYLKYKKANGYSYTAVGLADKFRDVQTILYTDDEIRMETIGMVKPAPDSIMALINSLK